MQLQEEINDPMSSLSFSYYYSDSLTAMAAAKVSREFKQEQAAQFHELNYVDEEEFEFSIDHLSDEEFSGKQIDLPLIFPIFHHKQLTKNEADLAVEEIDYASSFRMQVQKLFVNDVEESSSSSSREAYKSESVSGMFCMWRSKSKKSSSNGSGSRRWEIWNLLRPKKVDGLKQKRNVNSEEVTTVAGKLKTTSFHELFYVQKRAVQKGDKMKTFLPYRQHLLGLFVNINRIRNKQQQGDYHFII